MADISMRRESILKRKLEGEESIDRMSKLIKVEACEEEEEDFSNEPTMYSCDMCEESFVTRPSLVRHQLVTHDGEAKYRCSFCKASFPKKDELSAHISTEHGGAKFSCKHCGRNVSRRDHLVHHIRNVHPELYSEEKAKSNEPIFSSIKIETEDIVKSEIEYNSEENELDDYEDRSSDHLSLEGDSSMQITVEPDLPSGQYGNEEDNDDEEDIEDQLYFDDDEEGLYDEEPESPEDYDPITKIHASLNGIRVDRKHQCEDCGASFMSRINLQRHQTTHSANRPHKCPMCSKGFVRKEHLTKHLSSVHSGMKFTCEFCGKDISRKDHLIRHIRNVHPTEYLGIPPELAQQTLGLDLPLSALQASGLVISDKALLSMQPKPKKPYLQCDMCEQHFFQINDLHEHQSTAHSDIRRFKCNYCPKAFKRKEHLMKHEVLHTGEKNFSCDNCGKEFPRKDALQDHIRRIHGTDSDGSSGSLPCNFCDKVFLQRPNLLRHMKNIHGLIVNIPPPSMSSDGESSSHNAVVRNLPPKPNLTAAPRGNSDSGDGSLIPNFMLGNSFKNGSSKLPFSGGGMKVNNPLSFLSVNMRDQSNFNDTFNFNGTQTFSCAICSALFHNEKLYKAHLNSHKKAIR